MGRILEGKRGVIMGVANNASLAWACAKLCIDEGAKLAFSYLGSPQEKRLRELLAQESIGASCYSCDVTKDEDISSFFAAIKEEFGTIDFVLHSMAYTDKECLKNPFSQTSRAQFALTLDISAYSLVAVSREAAALMPNGGSVAALSFYGAEKVVPRYNVMGVAKAALEASARYLAEDLGSKGIRVNCLSAGAVRTLAASAVPGFSQLLETSKLFAPLRRTVTQEDVARSLLYLLSDLSSGVTGETLHVDAGLNAVGVAFLDGDKTIS